MVVDADEEEMEVSVSVCCDVGMRSTPLLLYDDKVYFCTCKWV